MGTTPSSLPTTPVVATFRGVTGLRGRGGEGVPPFVLLLDLGPERPDATHRGLVRRLATDMGARVFDTNQAAALVDRVRKPVEEGAAGAAPAGLVQLLRGGSGPDRDEVGRALLATGRLGLAFDLRPERGAAGRVALDEDGFRRLLARLLPSPALPPPVPPPLPTRLPAALRITGCGHGGLAALHWATELPRAVALDVLETGGADGAAATDRTVPFGAVGLPGLLRVLVACAPVGRCTVVRTGDVPGPAWARVERAIGATPGTAAAVADDGPRPDRGGTLAGIWDATGAATPEAQRAAIHAALSAGHGVLAVTGPAAGPREDVARALCNDGECVLVPLGPSGELPVAPDIAPRVFPAAGYGVIRVG